ncbi:MAG: hypothetical protein Q4E64_09420 [Phascolarctobacterium sp.]|uniref:hypothetical protein n=1 Tax=Phascolarctobacterium sp. TaxID=2049039 RepID=UPI0026DCD03F|nr:hypothetical protein [Phascolarctobacterium sp.]MDO4922024.1 hypothetical protein [Phascolarctobacterium sp.]
MLELAHKLADSDAEFFGGWVLAGAEAHIHGHADILTNKELLRKERKCIIQVLGEAQSGGAVKELRVFLLLPKQGLGSKAPAQEQPQGVLAAEHCFTVEEIGAYVAFTGDENIIHQGDHPVVPGLCMAAWLQRALQLRELDWRISFLSPVYAGDALKVYRIENELRAYVGAAKVFVIKF